jgi:hypothetical protein
MDPSSGSGATDIGKSELKNQELVVGASGFEPEASCAQGRRATRLRYAPTELRRHSTVLSKMASSARQLDCAITVPKFV